MAIRQEKIEEARNTDLPSFCQSLGYRLEKKGRGDFRIIGKGGLLVKDDKYYLHGDDQGGNPIDFCITILEMTFKDAVNSLIRFQRKGYEMDATMVCHAADKQAGKKKSIINRNDLGTRFRLPERSDIMGKDKVYLGKHRKLTFKLVDELRRKQLIYQDNRGNCVFPCYDKLGYHKGAILRGTDRENKFVGRSEGSDTSYGWVVKPILESDTVIITESPIDAMSIMVLFPEKKDYYFLALGGVFRAGIHTFIDSYPNVKKLVLATDNDQAGMKLINETIEEYHEKYEIEILQPESAKDWNEELIAMKSKK